MGHNPSNRDTTKGERKAAVENRTPEEILKGIRGNLAAHLSVTPNDIQFLLGAFDAEREFSHKLAEESLACKAKIVDLQALLAVQAESLGRLNEQVEQFRSVYEQENRSTTVKVERVASYGDGVQENLMQTAANALDGDV